MSVAENPTTEQLRRNPQHQLALGSAIGAVLVLAGLAFVFAGLPMAWSMVWKSFWEESLQFKPNEFLAEALLILLELIVIGALLFFSYGTLQQQRQPGLRAGIVFAAIYIFIVLWIGAWLGDVMDNQFSDNHMLGWIVLAFTTGLMLAGAGFVYLQAPGWYRFVDTVEHQGWFHAYAYKGNQGVRVRRGTILGILAVGICGIVTLATHRSFGAERAGGNDWYWLVPYSRQVMADGNVHLMYIPLMFKVHMIMPIVLGVLLIWFSWRVVNIPIFADFLIATEAEMNKVSWTNRRRLFQDTIVVLVTVFLFTTFLFVIDVLWIKILSAPGIQVLLIDTRAEAAKQQEKAQW